MKRIAFAAVALAAAAALPAFAQRAPDAPGRFAQPLTRAEVQSRVQARFARADADRDGFITQEEVRGRRGEARERRHERRGDPREALFARLDVNGDGMLSREEFAAPRALRDGFRQGPRGERFGRRGGQRMGGRPGGFGGRAFAALDTNRDGRVSLQEAQSRALQAFDRADSNRDGTVTPEERRAARQAFRAQRRG